MYELPKLPYAYDALEPSIDAKTMEIHHTKHHQGYVDKLNAALEKHPEFDTGNLSGLLENISNLPTDIREAVRNNGGGHANHSLFWKLMSPNPRKEPTGDLKEAIHEAFGSIEEYKEKFTQEALGRFGSGWVWLSMDAEKNLRIHSTPNQDSPLLEEHIPIIGLDVWEHAYYLKYQNKRGEYIKAWWNVLDWNQAQKNFNLEQ